MKKISSLGLLSLLMFMSIYFISCSDDDKLGSEADLIGTWQEVKYNGWIKENGKILDEWELEEGDEVAYITLNEDGVFESRYKYRGQWEHGAQGTWRYKDGKLYIYDEEEDENIVYTVKSLSSSRLTTEYYKKFTEEGTGIVCEIYENITYNKVTEI